MIIALIQFELIRRLKMFSTYVYGIALFALGGLTMASSAGLFSDVSAGAGSERVWANGPYSVFANQTIMALFGLFMVAAVFGQAASQDFTTGTWPLIFTRNVKKLPYLSGRFLGAWIFSSLLFLAIPVGQLIVALGATFKSGAPIGPHRLDLYLWPWLVGVVPLLFISGAVFFSLAALTRQMAPVYVGMVVLVLGYFVLSAAIGDVQNRTLGAIADPFGFITFDVVTKYWTPAERNRDLVPLTGLFLLNKFLWLAVGAAILSFTVNRFRTTIDEQRGKGKTESADNAAATPLPKVTIAPTLASWWSTSLNAGWMHFKDVLKSPVYWAFIFSGLLFTTIAMMVSKEIFGTATLPVTWQVLEFSGGVFRTFTFITVTFYAGELVWKERDAQVADIIDATRAPTWVSFVSKAFAMVLIVASLQVVAAVTALGGQLSRGFFDIEWRLYATELIGFGFMKNLIIAALALAVQYLINQKYLAHGAMVAYFGSRIALGLMGVEEPLLLFGYEPGIRYSDMNGYGHWVPSVLLFRTYWYAFSGLLLVLAFVASTRGRETALRVRLQLGRLRLTTPWRAFVGVCVLTALATGGRILERTHFHQKYKTSKDAEKESADYEKKWKSWAEKAMPRITDSDVRFDIFPYDDVPHMKVTGTWTFTNKTDVAIPSVLVNWDSSAKRESLSVAGATTPLEGELDEGVAVFKLEPPLEPGQSRELKFVFDFDSDPWAHNPRREVVGNGTFFNNFALPSLGYFERAELEEDGVRAKYDLKPKERMLDRDDPKGLAHNYIRTDSDLVGFRATVSTAADQIGIAPGTLTKEWTEGDRRFFRYEMDQPILNFFSVLSARYAVKEDEWNGVKLQVFYDPKHPYNVDRMMQSMKDTLAYCSEAFGPYQHHQARILEFPRYASFAQSFPNTIPYSEAVGFIARVRDDNPEDIDYPTYITAHEIAHQWWAHQVIGGNVQGATVTSETMAQYSSLMVMKHRYGPEKMRKFLKYELDHYLIGRTLERKKEVPLSRVENQGYIHYNKGSLVMYWLQDLVGEETVNRAMKKYVAKVKFQGPPYTNSTELLSFIRAEVDPQYLSVIDDLFENITTYENRATAASAKKNAAGVYDVTIKITAVKYRNDEKGEQTEVDFEDVMEIGGVDKDGSAVCTEKRKIKKGDSELTFSCPILPARAGVDPLNKLVDRNSDDNTEPVVE